MSGDWLFAVLNPTDLAPRLAVRPVGLRHSELLALLVSQQQTQYTRFRSLVAENEVEMLTEGRALDDLIAAVEISLLSDDHGVAADRLRDLIVSDELEDLSSLCAALLLCSTFMAWEDRSGEAVTLLTYGLDRIGKPNTSLDRLWNITLLQQLVLRRNELDGGGYAEARSVSEELTQLHVQTFPAIELRRHLPWGSGESFANVIDALRQANEGFIYLFESRAGLSDRWSEIAGRAASKVSLTANAAAADGLDSFVDELFAQRVSGPRRNYWHRLGQAEAALRAGLLSSELLGQSNVLAWRAELGRYRFLVERDSDTLTLAFALRMLRLANEKDAVGQATRWLIRGGPLQSLRNEAAHVMSRRAQPLRVVECVLLQAAAPLLNADAASAALDRVIETADARFPLGTLGYWEALSSQMEAAWQAIVALAVVAGDESKAASTLFRYRREMPSDELLDRGLSRAVGALNWDKVDSATASDWREWLGYRTTDDCPYLAQAIQVALTGVEAVPDRPTLTTIAAALNNAMRGQSYPRYLVAESEAVVRSALRSTREDALNGRFSLGSVSAADVAAGLVCHAGATDLWADLIAFLLDLNVSRTDTRPAFERLARESQGVPEDLVEEMRRSIGDVLYRTTTPMGDDVDPYPSALRLLIVTQAIKADQALAETLVLTSSEFHENRREGAATLGVLARVGADPWVGVLAMQLSYDSEPRVQAEAGRALALLRTRSADQGSLIDRQLLRLLRHPGVLVPSFTLHGLVESKSPLSPILTATVEALATDHIAHDVRAIARAALGSLVREVRP